MEWTQGPLDDVRPTPHSSETVLGDTPNLQCGMCDVPSWKSWTTCVTSACYHLMLPVVTLTLPKNQSYRVNQVLLFGLFHCCPSSTREINFNIPELKLTWCCIKNCWSILRLIEVSFHHIFTAVKVFIAVTSRHISQHTSGSKQFLVTCADVLNTRLCYSNILILLISDSRPLFLHLVLFCFCFFKESVVKFCIRMLFSII